MKSLENNTERHFTAMVGAGQSTELAFRVAGPLQEIHVKEGQNIKRGELIARLDGTDFQTEFDDAKAKHQLAKVQ